eukprot:TRINITY_DN952_c0_g1_i1.p1 TRINITY_DN952_c0_g1~~TRINITY_DN952_c0_g1_i1.p1  ORF type:complete len:213 (+),score=54.12 TRINITY_DN952_c0_g1_i1:139-777(+)
MSQFTVALAVLCMCFIQHAISQTEVPLQNQKTVSCGTGVIELRRTEYKDYQLTVTGIANPDSLRITVKSTKQGSVKTLYLGKPGTCPSPTQFAARSLNCQERRVNATYAVDYLVPKAEQTAGLWYVVLSNPGFCTFDTTGDQNENIEASISGVFDAASNPDCRFTSLIPEINAPRWCASAGNWKLSSASSLFFSNIFLFFSLFLSALFLLAY